MPAFPGMQGELRCELCLDFGRPGSPFGPSSILAERPNQTMNIYELGVGAAALVLLGACTVQPAYERPAVEAPGRWSNAGGEMPTQLDRNAWWRLLRDPAIDQLVSAGLRDNPTLAETVARIDQARAALSVENAQKTPTVGIEAGATYARDRAGVGSGTTGQTTLSAGARLGWEIDLWGRIREKSNAARHRISARTADAEGARLSVVSDIVDAAIALRACQAILEIRDHDIASRETELKIDRARLALGSIAPFTVSAADSNLASARTGRIAQDEACSRRVNALVALSGVEPHVVRSLLTPPAAEVVSNGDEMSTLDPVPLPPSLALAVPATVLRAHPAVVATEAEAMARWSEIGVAKAERLPRVDLLGVLTGQWIHALGSSNSYVSSSAGAGLAVPLFDGGSGAAKVRGAEAAYREAAAQMVFVIRFAIRDIEDGLAARQSAEARIETTRAAFEAARFTVRANLARWRAGAISQFELEETRRQFNAAREELVTASADRALAWVSLVRRTGSATYLDGAGNDMQPTPLAGQTDGNNGQ